MSTPAERLANDTAVKAAIEAAANNDGFAQRYLWQIAAAARVLDDLVDGDKPVPAHKTVEVFQGLLIDLQRNPFFLRNRDFLTGLHVVALNAWLDANEWEQSANRTEQLYAHVLRDLISELLPAVAYLTGGWAHCRAHSLDFRQAFKKEI